MVLTMLEATVAAKRAGDLERAFRAAADRAGLPVRIIERQVLCVTEEGLTGRWSRATGAACGDTCNTALADDQEMRDARRTPPSHRDCLTIVEADALSLCACDCRWAESETLRW